MTLSNERCPECGHTDTTWWEDTGETTCSNCHFVVNTTYEPPYDPDRTRNLGKPGRQVLDRAVLLEYSMSPRLGRLQNQQKRVPMVELVRKEIEASPFPSVVILLALQVWRCIPTKLFSASRADTSIDSYGLDENATSDEKRARREDRARWQAWGVLAIVDQARPIGWRHLAEIRGVEADKCLRFADRLQKALGYDADGIRTRVMVNDIIDVPRPTMQSQLEDEQERLLTWLGNKLQLPHTDKMGLCNRAWKILDAWGIPSMPLYQPLGNKSSAQLSEMAVSMALLDLSYAPDVVRHMQESFPKQGMVQIRKDIIARKFTPWPSMSSGPSGNPASVDDDFSSLGGGSSV